MNKKLDSLLNRQPSPILSNDKMKELATKGQHPAAIVICCSDSRVIPEYILDAEPGEIFVIRTAGNALLEGERCSLDYAYHHLGLKDVLLIGHTHCGAIATCIDHYEEISPLLRNIRGHIGNCHDYTQASIAHCLGAKQELLSLHNDLNVIPLLYEIETNTLTKLEEETL